MTIHQKDFVPKYIRIQETLRRDIEKQRFRPNDQIPTEVELMEKYQVSRITVSNAIKGLVAEGFLVRQGPKGTFVAERKTQPFEIQSPLAGLFLRTQGHVYGELSRDLIGGLQSEGCFSMVYDTSVFELQPDRIGMSRTQVETLLSHPFEYVVVDGVSRFPFELLQQTQTIKQLFFIVHFETSLLFPHAVKVLTDYREGGYSVVKYLLEMGHKRIALFTYEPQPQPYFDIQSLLSGCRHAYEEKELDFQNLFSLAIYQRDEKINEDMLGKLLSRPDRPTAIFCFSDSRATSVFSAVKKMGLVVPRDVSIVGYYNTPWCMRFDVPLTSVSINEHEIAQTVHRLINRPSLPDNTVVWVNPELIIRASSGPCIAS